MVREWQISSLILDRIAAETSEWPDREICGLLFGAPGEITAAEPCRNVAGDPSRRFEIDPAALLAAYRQARAGGPAVIGCYHSHPTGDTTPSPRDAADAAGDGMVWLIAAAGRVTAWLAVEHGPLHGRFAPLGLRAVPPFANDGVFRGVS